jgi:hypothetical protein
LESQPSSRTGENSPYGMIGGIEETSASFEARTAPRSYPTIAEASGPNVARCEVSLLDNLVGGGQQRFRDGEADCFGGLEVDGEHELGRLHNRQVGGLCAVENFAGMDASLTKSVHVAERYRAAMREPLDTNEGVNERALALWWAVEFLMESLPKLIPATEITDAFVLLAELGLLDEVPGAPGSSAKQ